MPGNCFSLAVFISCKNDALRFLCELLEIGDDRFRFFRDNVSWFEVMLYVDADLALRQIANMAIRRFNDKIFADELADRFCFGGGLNNNEIHGF